MVKKMWVGSGFIEGYFVLFFHEKSESKV